MSRLRDLVSKGVRLVVTNTEEGERTTSPPPPPREIPAEEFTLPELDKPGPSPSAVPADVEGFDPVYDEAGIAAPAHGYGVAKAAEMLENKRLASLGREVKATAVLAALEAAGVSIKDVVTDAVRRDGALDAFEAAKERELTELKAASEERIASIRAEIEAFLKDKNAEIEGLKKAVEDASAAFAQLQIRKRREEDRLHDVVAHFVESAQNPVTTSRSSAVTAAPPKDGAGV
jgi:F0F1-type ATP synthase membrane subunit b/b'